MSLHRRLRLARNNHLALLDASTLVSPDDFVFYNERGASGVSEVFHLDPHNHEKHRWFYFSAMGPEEALIVKQFDSDPRQRCRYTFRAPLQVNNAHKGEACPSIEVTQHLSRRRSRN